MKMKMDRKLDEIKKGPWKAEEDDVLLNHVKKYGPRDWSSIRSKGLLQRTGKSCRLRWVNKLRPNLKNGCKFSAEEERTVIELQGQFGNKWARIATYLPGRTDNDVKNFWSSRQKRLARILHNSGASSSSNSKSHRFNNPKSGLHVPPDPVTCPEAANLSSAVHEVTSSVTELYPSSYTGPPPKPVGLMPLPDLSIKPELQPPAYVTNLAPTGTYLCADSQNQYQFPQIAAEQQPQPQRSIGFLPESQELVAQLDDPYFCDIFGPIESTYPFPLTQPFFEPLTSCRNLGRDEPDVFFDDLPADMFDQVDSLRSP